MLNLNEKLSKGQFLRLQATFHALLSILFASVNFTHERTEMELEIDPCPTIKKRVRLRHNASLLSQCLWVLSYGNKGNKNRQIVLEPLPRKVLNETMLRVLPPKFKHVL